MILKQTKSISKSDYLLNSLLDDGLFIENEKQLGYFCDKYFKHRNISIKDRSFNYVLINKSDFINYMINRYGR